MHWDSTGAEDTALVAARSPVSEVVELHTHREENGVMRMRQVEKIELPAGETITLKPGGLHVMLIGLKQPLELDTEIPVSLVFADGSEKSVMMPVVNVMRGHGNAMKHGQGMGQNQSAGRNQLQGNAQGHQQCQGMQHGEGYEHGKGHAMNHGEGYEHGKGHGMKHGEGYEQCQGMGQMSQ